MRYLLETYYPKIAKITPELASLVIERWGGICEHCKTNKASEIHHLVGRRRKVWSGNLIYFCKKCHTGENGIHQNAEMRLKYKLALQKRYFEMGFTKDEVRYLMGSKSNKLYINKEEV